MSVLLELNIFVPTTVCGINSSCLVKRKKSKLLKKNFVKALYTLLFKNSIVVVVDVVEVLFYFSESSNAIAQKYYVHLHLTNVQVQKYQK